MPLYQTTPHEIANLWLTHGEPLGASCNETPGHVKQSEAGGPLHPAEERNTTDWSPCLHALRGCDGRDCRMGTSHGSGLAAALDGTSRPLSGRCCVRRSGLL